MTGKPTLDELEQRLRFIEEEQTRKDAETALRKSKSQLQAILQSTVDAFLATDKDGNIIFMNQRFPELWQIPQTLLKNGTVNDFLEHIHEQLNDPRAFLEKTHHLYHSVEESSEILHFRDGRIVEQYSRSLLQDHEYVGRVWSFRDITKAKQIETALIESEKRYRLLVENAREAIFVAQQGTIHFANKITRELAGVQDTELASIPFEAFIHPEDREIVRERHFKRMQGIEFPSRYSFRIIDCSENIKWVELNTVSIEWEGKPATLNFLSDITERKRTEDENRERSMQLQKLALELSNAEDKERQRIAMVLHDDLQQYLAAVRFDLQSLSTRITDTALRERVDHLDHLIDISIEKCRTLSHELSPPILHQMGFLPAIEWLIADMQKKYGLKVRLQKNREVEPVSPALSHMLFRSVRELLFNVAKHSGVDSADVHVDERADHFRICVSDKGKGCDLAALRGKMGIAPGLGLFNIEERIRYMGGCFEIEGGPGKGCSIILHVPKTEESCPGEAKSVNQLNSGIQKFSAGDESARVRIVLADDHSAMREGLSSLLKLENGLEIVAQAADGIEAVKMASELNPDVVLMDVTMPNMDGIQATSEIRKNHPHIRIIGLSMHDDPCIQTKMLKAGAAAYIYKTASTKKIVEAIHGTIPN